MDFILIFFIFFKNNEPQFQENSRRKGKLKYSSLYSQKLGLFIKQKTFSIYDNKLINESV